MYSFLIQKRKTRNVEEPISEGSVRGPRVGFTEVLSDNTALLRLHGENEGLSIKILCRRTGKERISCCLYERNC